MLNENLKVELIVHLNGKMLHSTTVFKSFDIQFISELTFAIKRDTFFMGETLFVEDDMGDTLYYVCSGKIHLFHRKTYSFIKELRQDDFLGECAFFSQGFRKASARSSAFTEVITLSR